MSTPSISKTTISSRSKMALPNGGQHQEILTSSTRIKSSMPPPSQIARNKALRTNLPTPAPTIATSRLERLANGFPSSMRDARSAASKQASVVSSNNVNAPKVAGTHKTHTNAPTAQAAININGDCRQSMRTKIPPHTISKIGTKQLAKTPAPQTTSERNTALHSRMNGNAQLNSRSSSVLSSISSSTASKRVPVTSIRKETKLSQNLIPDTNTIRKGLAKFSNPIEAQRQHQALSLKNRQQCEIIEAREKEIDKLQDQLNRTITKGVGYATTVQYLAVKLKLDTEKDLVQECKDLKSRVEDLLVTEEKYEEKLQQLTNQYNSHIQVQEDIRKNLENGLDEQRKSHSETLERLKVSHQDELNDLNEKHSTIEEELKARVDTLESELRTKCKDFEELRKEYEVLNSSFVKLEESLTKDKDARVKYAQEKIIQLQKDVESLNSVLEMRSERIHALEKDSDLLGEVQNECNSLKDTNKALNQQLESLNAALEKKREQFEKLIAEHENVLQDLKKERKERRRMTMRTEQLEYVLNESCATESNMGFNSSMRDLDSADHLV